MSITSDTCHIKVANMSVSLVKTLRAQIFTLDSIQVWKRRAWLNCAWMLSVNQALAVTGGVHMCSSDSDFSEV